MSLRVLTSLCLTSQAYPHIWLPLRAPWGVDPSFPLAHPPPSLLLSLLSPAFTLDWEAGRGLGLESPGLPPRPPSPGQAPRPVLHLLSPFLSLPIRAQWRPEESEDYVSNRCASEQGSRDKAWVRPGSRTLPLPAFPPSLRH